jgi:iron complex outermembrane receptor protein
VIGLIAACFTVASPGTLLAGQNQSGRIEGRIIRADDSGVEGATVLLRETQATTITDPDGRFSFPDVQAGSYSVAVILGENSITIENLLVSAGATRAIEERVDWGVGFVETLTVVSTSRRLERLVEAPASVTRVTAAEISEKAAHGQVAKLVEFAPGAQLTQSGVYDYNFNTRGFNSTLNRRVVVLFDGRNSAAPFLGAQEWAAVGFPLDDLASAELVRGPSAALYGANASSGILNLVTKEPRLSQGGLVRGTFGELGTANFDFRWAGNLSRVWSAKAVAGVRYSGDFTVSRMGAAEYSVPCPPGVAGDCLPQEAVPLARVDDNDVLFAGFRADRYFDNGMVLTMEGGLSDVAGPVVQTGVGRTQVTDVRRPWGRFNVNTDRANLLVAYTGRNAPGQLNLAAGTNSTLKSHMFQIEGQTDRTFRQDRIRLVVGSAVVLEYNDSFDEGRQGQSLLFEPVDSHQEAVFGQADWNLTRSLRVVLAGRGDFSSLHDAHFSPKGSVVYEPTPSHGIRLTYNEAFQVPNHSEFFLQADAAPPADLSALNAFCTPFGVNCGFGRTRVLAVGNGDMQLEEIRTIEVGYKGLIVPRALMTVDYHRSRASDFITDLLPQLGTPLGRVNPNFGPWRAPAGLPPAVEAAVRAAAPPILSNNLDGSNVLVAASYTNFGRVDTQGVDVGLNYLLPAGWRGAAAYSWFDFSIEDSVPGLDAMVLPNSPEHTFSFSVGYAHRSFDADFSLRRVARFRWAVGPFQGDVESYATADVTGNYRLTPELTASLSVANVFDDEHWESFGGDILRRRLLVSMAYSW